MSGEKTGRGMNEILRDDRGLSLTKKKQRGILGILFSPMGIILAFILIGVLIVLAVINGLAQFILQSIGAGYLFNAVMVIRIINSRSDPTSKNAWLLVVTIFPVIGPLLYIYISMEIGRRAMKRRTNQLVEENRDAVLQDPETLAKLEAEDPRTAQVVHYMQTAGSHPAFADTAVRYYPLGEKKWEALLEDLRQAKSFIFLEYFIVEEGVMWGKMLEVLEQKAREGVEVRVMYDGTCEFVLLPRNYPKLLEKIGIKAKVFARLMPLFSTAYNYRNHRKIAVIDGKVGYTGGVNLGDEYINKKDVFGHWKDTAVRMEGPAVDVLTLLFMEDWNLDTEDRLDRSYFGKAVPQKAPGYVIPLGDNPMDEERTAENVYIDFLNRADRYVHIMTPYLILDGELENALRVAAQRGVDVSLILPGVPDKKAVYALAWQYFPALLSAGVKIYTYTPGFVHAKVFVSDDERAFVGTINLDYRSLYHHFECGTYLCRSQGISDVEQDFQETLAKCEPVTMERVASRKFTEKVTGSVARVLAPML